MFSPNIFIAGVVILVLVSYSMYLIKDKKLHQHPTFMDRVLWFSHISLLSTSLLLGIVVILGAFEQGPVFHSVVFALPLLAVAIVPFMVGVTDPKSIPTGYSMRGTLLMVLSMCLMLLVLIIATKIAVS